MPQGLLEVNGTIEVIQFWPEGRSDADTAKIVVTIAPDSVRFRENKARPFRVTHFLDGATVGIPVNGKRKPAVNAKGQLTIRLQGIDAPELHFQPSALEASEFPGLDQAGFAAVKKQYHDAKVVHPYRQLLGATTTKALHDFLASAGSSTLPCRVFTQVDLPNEVFDKYGRMVADIEVTIGGNTVSINEWAVQTGSAFPAFYSSMSDTEITTLRGLGNTAIQGTRCVETSCQNDRRLRFHTARTEEGRHKRARHGCRPGNLSETLSAADELGGAQ